MAELVVCEFMAQAAVADLERDFNVLYAADLVDRPLDLQQAVADARGLIVRNRTRVTEQLLAAAPKLRVVGRLGVGLDNIDLEACRTRGVTVCPATGANDDAVAEYVITTAAMLLRRAYTVTGLIMSGAWPRTDCMGHELAGKQIGLIGMGAISRQVAARALPLGLRVAGCDPYVAENDQVWRHVARLTLDELLTGSDIVSLHVPLSDNTRHLIGPANLAKMRADAVLINSARGGVVDEHALAQALHNHELAGAALDVFENEPPGAEQLAPFNGLQNVILTPHIAGVTEESNVRVSAVTAQNVRRVLLQT